MLTEAGRSILNVCVWGEEGTILLDYIKEETEILDYIKEEDPT